MLHADRQAVTSHHSFQQTIDESLDTEFPVHEAANGPPNPFDDTRYCDHARVFRR